MYTTAFYSVLCFAILLLFICIYLADQNQKLREVVNITPEPTNALEIFSEDLTKCVSLYSKLVKEYTPQKYDDPSLREKAQNLFNELTINQFNYLKLQDIEKGIDICLK
ncbi:hypothetical protein K5X82_05565 [Halosquirtibacter xylanolyticus]|uniref:hypothetical protein n=1 Tax=Halosquirtibacter xylanolyticus TaxID=3374599 RepID=UPI0037499DD7|nr:hypothetical protein K5X82_05565 [Prolixibacteraceae bacterium]